MCEAERTEGAEDHHPGRVALLCFPARPGQLKLVRCVVREASTLCGCASNVVEDMVLAIDEACQNIIRYAYKDIDDGQVELEILCKDGILEFRLQDFAPAVDKDKIKPSRPKKLRPGGLGVFLMHEVMDEVGFLPVPPGKGNLLRLAKRVERGPK